MIHVDRTPAPAPLVGDDSLAAKESRRVNAFFADPANAKKKFDFKVYRHREVKKALEQLFHGKCAYCESKYLQNQPGDVEHFRPKGGYVVAGELQKPGYWWLAATWSNLLPSCIDCNRKRTQEFAGDVEKGSGKENLFPILAEQERARAPGEERREVCLLLDPCRDHPEKWIEFTDEGVIKARSGIEALDQRRVEESIKTYGLRRLRLVEARRDHYLLLLGRYDLVVELLDQFRQEPGDAEVRRKLANALGLLQRSRRSEEPFALMARQLIDPTLDAIRPFLVARLEPELSVADGSGDIVERFVAKYARDEGRRDRAARLAEVLRP